VDYPRGLRSSVATAEGPSADLLLPRSEVGLEIEQRVGLANEFCNTGLLQSEVFKEHGPLFVGFQFCDVGFDGGADDHDGRALCLCCFFDEFDIGIPIHYRSLIDIADIEHGFGCQELQFLHHHGICVVQFNRTGGLT